jgi:alkanesulfonate monooxygenase SsuD/methylene tetrahydromethanopterin reductase-like flavin-dependent oxidoreductase (luciferase family)
MSTGYIRWALDVIGQGARSAGKEPASQDIAAPLMVPVAADAKEAMDAVKPGLAYYLHRVETVVHAHSRADAAEVERVREVTAERCSAVGAAVVTDEIIDTFAVAGEVQLAIRRLREYAEAGQRRLIIQHVPGPERVEGLTLIAKEVVPHVI